MDTSNMYRNTQQVTNRTAGSWEVEEISTSQNVSDTTAIESLRQMNGRRRIMENYFLVWLDANIDETQEEFRDSLAQLQSIVNTIDTYTDTDDCVNYLKTIQDEKIFMIVSSALSQTFVPLVHDLPQLDSIFIFCEDKIRHEQWINDWFKVKGVFTQIDPICDGLRQAIHVADQNSVSVSFLPTSEASSNQNAIQLDPTFLYTQLLKEALLEIYFEESQSILEFVSFSRSRCTKNATELNKIEQFEHGYHDHTPIWWYTFECSFLYRTLNRALGLLEVDTILKMGFFIRDLHQDLVKLHDQQQSSPDHNTLTSSVVYRGQGLSEENFSKLKNSVGGLMSFNNFLSTSQQQQVALEFIQQVRAKADKIPVLFVMTIDPATTGPTATPFALIDQVSYFEAEREILFSMNSVFCIDEIKEMDGTNQGLWQVKLTLTNSDSDPSFAALINCLRAENTGSTGWTRLGQVLIKLNKYDKAEELYRTLIESTTDEKWNAHYYYMLGLVLYSQSEYQKAISFYEKAAEIFQKSDPPRYYDLATAYNNIGLVYCSTGDYQKALAFYEKALEIKQQIFSPNDPRLTSTYNNIGVVYYNLANYMQALLFYEKSVEIQKISLPAYHPDLAKSYNCIAVAYLKLGQFTKSLEYYDKIVDIQKKSLPPNHPDTASSYNNMGEVYKHMGDYMKALSYYEQALEMKQKSLSPNDPNFASSYNSIAEVYLAMGDYSKSLPSYEKTMEIKKKYLPSNHPDIAAGYINMGNVYCCMSEYSTAISCFEKAIEIQEKMLTPNHDNLVSCYYNIGVLYHNLGNYPAALSSLKHCFEIQNMPLDTDNPMYAYPYQGLGKVYQSMNDYTTALNFYQKTLDIRERTLPSQHPDLAATYSNIGDIHRLLGHYEQAMSFLRKALDIQENVTCNRLEIATTYISLGEILREMQDYSSALIYYEKALEIREKLLPKMHSDLAVIHHSLAQNYHATQDYSSAIEHAKFAVEIAQKNLPEQHPHLLYYKETLEKFQKNS